MAVPDLVFDLLPPDALRQFIADHIDMHNVAQTGRTDWRPLGYFLRDARAEWVGGLVGYVWGGWLYVRLLWVVGSLRGQSQGTRLLLAAENHARALGATAATLETFSFQAPSFYQRHGYIVFATLEDYPPGHTKFFLRKIL